MHIPIVVAVLVASSMGAHKLNHGVVSFNPEHVCVASETENKVIDIAIEEFSKSCKSWTPDKMRSALSGVRLFWWAGPWLQESPSCLDVPKHMQVWLANGRVSCLVVGMQFDNQVHVAAFEAEWSDTLPHELAHLFQSKIDNFSDPRHVGYVSGGCIAVAIERTVHRYRSELQKPQYQRTSR